MERSTLGWLAAGLIGLLVAAGVGFTLSSDEQQTTAPQTTVLATPPATSSTTPPPADARRPEEAPTAIADDAWAESETGLRTADLVVGAGDVAAMGSPVVVEYTGWLEDSSEMFDSSKRRARPLLFTMGRGDAPIPGWDEAVEGMQVGGKRAAVFPPELAFGQTGRLPRIPRNATIRFEFELVAVGSAREAPQSPPVFDPTAMRAVGDVQAIDLVEGTGQLLAQGDTISLDYSAFLKADGNRFDSSLTRAAPATFEWGKNEMLEGVEMGIAGMKVGGTRLIEIPPELGYGVNGLRNYVPPQATLLFLVQLVEIEGE
jgi:FKBP-type peptidyl-prolyl cis-trans isomerase